MAGSIPVIPLSSILYWIRLDFSYCGDENSNAGAKTRSALCRRGMDWRGTGTEENCAGEEA